MKALTLKRPWAWAIFHGKSIENRRWAPPQCMLGERFAIHAGKGIDREGERFIRWALSLYALPVEAWCEGIIGTVVLDRTIVKPGDDPLSTSLWFRGPFGWCLRDQVELAEPIPCRGMQRLWVVPHHVMLKMRGVENP